MLFLSVPDYWDKSLSGAAYHEINLPTDSTEYKKVENAFKASSPKLTIDSVRRIQNKAIYKLYNVKREAMEEKYGRNFDGKEKMLFHGTSYENVEKINAGGLNRNYAGTHGNYRTLY